MSKLVQPLKWHGGKITAIAPWFGSKRTLAPEIVRRLGLHRAYCEPFCGSMAVLLAKPPCSFELVARPKVVANTFMTSRTPSTAAWPWPCRASRLPGSS